MTVGYDNNDGCSSKQAQRFWNKMIINLGFQKSNADPTWFLVSSNQRMEIEFLKNLLDDFKITIKPTSCYLGFGIKTNSDGVIENIMVRTH